MRQITALSGSTSDAPWEEPRGTVAALHHELSTGVFVHISLGAAGVLFRQGPHKCAIPLNALIALVRQHNPALGSPDLPPPAPVPAPKPAQPKAGA